MSFTVLYRTVRHCTVLFCSELIWNDVIPKPSQCSTLLSWWLRPFTFRFSMYLRKYDECDVGSKHPYLLCLYITVKVQKQGLRLSVRTINIVTVGFCCTAFSQSMHSLINHRINWWLQDRKILQNIKRRDNSN